MIVLKHSLHAAVANSEQRMPADRLVLRRPLLEHLDKAFAAPGVDTSVEIALKTVSKDSLFDSYIEVGLAGAPLGQTRELLVDSGNTCLVFPFWEDIAALPNFKADYQVMLQDVKEPWGCKANIVKGPIVLPKVGGGSLRIDGVTFFACKADAAAPRKANFGVGAVSPWSRYPLDDPQLVLQSPLSFAASLPVAEFDFVAGEILGTGGSPKTDFASRLYLHASMPAGFQTFQVIPGLAWMTMRAVALDVAGQHTAWPSDSKAYAVIDTGGTCVFLVDPRGLLHPETFPDVQRNPDWTCRGWVCSTVGCAISLTLGDEHSTYAYTIAPDRLPAAARGQTLVACKENDFMRDLYGLNTGGLSMLVNDLAIDYAGKRIGWKPK